MPDERTPDEYLKRINEIDLTAKICLAIAFVLAQIGAGITFGPGGYLISAAISLAVLAFFMLRFPDGPQL